MAGANLSANLATAFTKAAHRQAPALRWGVMIALGVIWLWAGYIGWVETGADAPLAIYRTLGALGVQEYYEQPGGWLLDAARFAGVFVPLVGLVFAFWGQMNRSLAQMFTQWLAGHVVIVGGGAQALALAADCRRRKDAVLLLARSFPEETADALRQSGVMVIAADPEAPGAVKAARAGQARHVVALTEDDGGNLRFEAAVRVAHGKSKRPLIMHTHLASPLLLLEAREMRRRGGVEAFEARPFAFAEIAARRLLRGYGTQALDIAHALQHPRPHFVILGFDVFAETVAVRVLMSLWSAHFEPPRVTVLTPNPDDVRQRFAARYPQAMRHALWQADFEAMKFDWDHSAVDVHAIDAVAAARGAPSAFVISTGDDSINIGLALAVQRACNAPAGGPDDPTRYPAPIFMKEASSSEFSKLWASGDKTARLDAYLQAFGASQEIATREMVLEGALDQGAAIAHWFYDAKIENPGAMTRKDMDAAMRQWSRVPEKFRNANRAVSDAALVKIWDLGMRPAAAGEAGSHGEPPMGEMMGAMARREHDRWNAERMLSGWRPGSKRVDELMTHDKLVAFETLSEGEIEKDRQQVRAAVAIARATHRAGLVARTPMAQPSQRASA